ncbi:hypothetical protein B566_EDAN009983 [Ephemera danica]|nr:hypothetical protein B566_EDAN009983 [Ephemera danica]
MAVPIQNCCVVFNLRQGTVIIAVIELFLSAVALVLLAMGLSHAQYAASLLAADMEESAIHEEETTALLYAASSDGGYPGPPHYHNEEHLLRAQQLGTGKISLFIFH